MVAVLYTVGGLIGAYLVRLMAYYCAFRVLKWHTFYRWRLLSARDQVVLLYAIIGEGIYSSRKDITEDEDPFSVMHDQQYEYEDRVNSEALAFENASPRQKIKTIDDWLDLYWRATVASGDYEITYFIEEIEKVFDQREELAGCTEAGAKFLDKVKSAS